MKKTIIIFYHSKTFLNLPFKAIRGKYDRISWNYHFRDISTMGSMEV